MGPNSPSVTGVVRIDPTGVTPTTCSSGPEALSDVPTTSSVVPTTTTVLPARGVFSVLSRDRGVPTRPGRRSVGHSRAISTGPGVGRPTTKGGTRVTLSVSPEPESHGTDPTHHIFLPFLSQDGSGPYECSVRFLRERRLTANVSS